MPVCDILCTICFYEWINQLLSTCLCADTTVVYCLCLCWFSEGPSAGSYHRYSLYTFASSGSCVSIQCGCKFKAWWEHGVLAFGDSAARFTYRIGYCFRRNLKNWLKLNLCFSKLLLFPLRKWSRFLYSPRKRGLTLRTPHRITLLSSPSSSTDHLAQFSNMASFPASMATGTSSKHGS
jgi:hypothetical protein